MTERATASLAWPVAFGVLPTMAFIPFLLHNAYPLFSAEALLVGGVGTLVGLAIGFAARAVGGRFDVLAGALFILLAVDLTAEAYELAKPVTVWAVTLAAGLTVSFLLRKQIANVLAVLAVAYWLAGLITPAAPYFEVLGDPSERTIDAPAIVHIILDEHIGVEGVSAETDPDGVMADLAATYTERGFRVFSRAFSRYRSTANSLPSAFQFAAVRGERDGTEGRGLSANYLFDDLSERGYALHVVGTVYIDFCKGRSDVASCVSYPATAIRALQDADLPAPRKAELIALNFSARVRLMNAVRRRLERLSGRVSIRHGKLSPMPGMDAVKRLPGLMSELGPGQFWVVHLILPHSPYAFDASCKLRSEAWERAESDQGGLSNTPERRQRVYGDYLAQTRCIHSLLAEIIRSFPTDTTIVIHGDHGSRITTAPQYRNDDYELTQEQMVDDYATFFAVRSPSFEPGLDRRMLPLDELLRQIYAPGRPLSDSMTLVHTPLRGRGHKTREMPVFEDPRIAAGAKSR